MSPRIVRICVISAVVAALVTGGIVAWAQFYRLRYYGEVVPGQVYRTPQPSERQLRGYIAQYGIRTVLSLRGNDASEVIGVPYRWTPSFPRTRTPPQSIFCPLGRSTVGSVSLNFGPPLTTIIE